MVDSVPAVKARLVLRGFEEQDKVRSDSPTCRKVNIRTFLTIAQAKGWTINSLDVKAAFLQGNQIQRDVFIRAPREAKSSKAVWKLRKVVYGLSDASRSWYLRLVEALESLGMKTLLLDKAVFIWKVNAVVQGMVIIHVDDMLFFGSEHFHLEIIGKFKKLFKISREEQESFNFLGVRLHQTSEYIVLEQDAYIEALSVDLVHRHLLKDKEEHASEEQKKRFREGVGQLGWLEGTTQPQLGFAFCQLSTVQSDPQMKDYSRYSKVIKDRKGQKMKSLIPNVDLGTLLAYSDASYGNLRDGGSQLGYLSIAGFIR